MPAAYDNWSLDLHRERDAALIAALQGRMRESGWTRKSQLMADMLHVYLGDQAIAPSTTGVPWAQLLNIFAKLVEAVLQVALAIRERPQMVYAVSEALPPSSNGNGHSPAPEHAEDPDDPLVKAMAGISFDF